MTRSNAVGSGCVRLLLAENLANLVAIHMSFLCEIGGCTVASFGGTSECFAKVFLQK